MDYSRLGSGASIGDADPARSRRVVRERTDHPTPVHQARIGHRPVAVIGRRGHRCVRSGHAERDAPASPGASASGGREPVRQCRVTGGTIRCAIQRPVSVDPVAMQDLGGYGIVAQSFEFLCGQNTDPDDPGGLVAGARRRAGSRTTTAPSGRSSSGPDAKWQHDGSPLTADDVVATMERLVAAGNSGLKGVLPSRWRGRDRRQHRHVDARSGERELPVPRLDLQRADGHHAEGLRRRARRSTLDRPGPAPWKLVNYNQQTGATFERNPDWWGGQTPLDGTEFIFFDETGPMITAYQGDQVDAIVQFDVLTGAALFNDPNFTLIAQPAALHRQIWMRVDKGAVRRRQGARGPRPHVGSRGARPAAVPGSRRGRQRSRHLAGLPVLRRGSRPAADTGRRTGQGSC